MAFKSCKEMSRVDWGRNGGIPQTGDVKEGCLQRIADATEKMAQSYTNLVDERDRYKRWYEEEKKRCQRLHHRVRGLRGSITRLKRKIS